MPKKGRIVVVNTTPIISLALIGQLSLLKQLYTEVIIPPAVRSELLAGLDKPGAAELLDADYIRTMQLIDPGRADLVADLDRGEAEVIALAQEIKADLVIIDERLARRYAKRLGLAVTGVLGVLLKAKQSGLLTGIRPLIEQLHRGGIYLGENVVADALRLADEL